MIAVKELKMLSTVITVTELYCDYCDITIMLRSKFYWPEICDKGLGLGFWGGHVFAGISLSCPFLPKC